jgi:flagellar hook protein FlgE
MSSLFAALGVAVSGLNAQSQSIGNISDDLSNAQTTGYKSIGTSFSDLVTASSATNNSPGGVSATPDYQNDVQGNIASTSTTTNLAISGQGYFDVTSASQDSSGATVFSGSNYYTRDGDFTLNKNGYMVNSSGYYLEGYNIAGGVVDTAQTVPVQISSLLDNPVATKAITYQANLPASAATGYSSTASTVEIYDSLGTTHQVSITWTQESTSTVPNTWLADIDVVGGNGAADYKTQALVTFNSAPPAGTIESVSPLPVGTITATNVATVAGTSDGTVTLAGFSSGSPATVTGMSQTITLAVTPAGATSPVNVSVQTTYGETSGDVGNALIAALKTVGVTATYSGNTLDITRATGSIDASAVSVANPYTLSAQDSAANAAGTEAGVNFSLNFAGTAAQSVDLNFGTLDAATGVTQYSSSSSTVSVSSISQDGLGEGSYSSISIDTSGIVSINYTNGSTREIYQIPLAQFNSPDNLQRGSGGVYTATLASGPANLHLSGTNGVGTISSSSLEASDVDIASEFTTMIVSQQVYSANAKVVSTVNSMLSTIIQAVQ